MMRTRNVSASPANEPNGVDEEKTVGRKSSIAPIEDKCAENPSDKERRVSVISELFDCISLLNIAAWFGVFTLLSQDVSSSASSNTQIVADISFIATLICACMAIVSAVKLILRQLRAG